MTITSVLPRHSKTSLSPMDMARRHHPRPRAGSHDVSMHRRRGPSSAAIESAEEQLLAGFLEHHPRQGAALDAILDDLDHLSSEVRQSRRAPLLLRSASSLHRVETMLLDAIVRLHPHRERAFDRLMDDLTEEDDQAARDEFDMHVDNDFDGMA